METTILIDIISTIGDFILWYRESKRPKFLKNIEFKKFKKRIKKAINNIIKVTDDDYSMVYANIVLEYINIIINRYGNIGHKHIKSIEYFNKDIYDDRYITTMVIDLPNNDKIYFSLVNNVLKDNSIVFDTTFSYITNSIPKFKFAETDVKYFSYDNGNPIYTNIESLPWKSNEENKNTKLYAYEILIKDIKEFLNDELIRAERILEK